MNNRKVWCVFLMTVISVMTVRNQAQISSPNKLTEGVNYENFKLPDLNNILVRATVSVIESYFEQVTSSISLFRESVDNDHHIIDSGFINEVLYNLHSNIVVEIEDHKILDAHAKLIDCDEDTFECKAHHQMRAYNLFFINDYETFMMIFKNLNPDEFRYSGYYLIIITQYRKNYGEDVSNIFKDMWKQDILNVNIILKPDESNKEVHLLTYNPFQYSSCGSARPFLLNIYRNDTFIWDGKLFPEKDKNLRSCPLPVAVFQTPPFMMIEKLDNGSYYTDGVDGIVLRVLSQKMNFTVDVKLPAEGKGVIYPNLTTTGAIRHVVDDEAEFIIGYMAKNALANRVMADSYYYMTSKQIWVVPAGKHSTPIEKLLKPFKILLWSMTSFVLALSLVVVFMLKYFAKTTRNFLYGRNIEYPALNIMNIFFGGSMPKTPTRNFARFIMMVFIMFCLIIRSAYQGAMFNFLRLNGTSLGVNSLDEMFERNFTFYILESSRFLIENVPNILEKSVFMHQREFVRALQWANDPEFHGAFLVSEDHLIFINRQNYPNVITNYAQEPLFSINLCIYLNKKSSLINRINRHLIALTTHGFINQWKSKFINKRFLLKQKENTEPQKLNMNQFNGGFQLLVAGEIAALAIFFLESWTLKFKFLRHFFDFFH